MKVVHCKFKKTSTSCALISLNVSLTSDLKTMKQNIYTPLNCSNILKLIRNVTGDWNYSLDKKIASLTLCTPTVTRNNDDTTKE